MAITWRSVIAPNQSSANALASSGIDTILGGLDGLSKAFQAPAKSKKEAEKLAFEQALKQAGLDQGQARIDNDTQRINNDAEQFKQRQKALLTAADLANDRRIEEITLENRLARQRFQDKLNQEANTFDPTKPTINPDGSVSLPPVELERNRIKLAAAKAKELRAAEQARVKAEEAAAGKTLASRTKLLNTAATDAIKLSEGAMSPKSQGLMKELAARLAKDPSKSIEQAMGILGTAYTHAANSATFMDDETILDSGAYLTDGTVDTFLKQAKKDNPEFFEAIPPVVTNEDVTSAETILKPKGSTKGKKKPRVDREGKTVTERAREQLEAR